MHLYLPDGLRDDELLYSALARSCRLQRMPTMRDMLQAAYDASTITASIDLPCRLDIVGSRLLCLLDEPRPGMLLSHRHTLFPFYAVGVDGPTAARARVAILGGPGGRLHGMLGIRPSNIRAPTHLRYCADCIASDRGTDGMAHWRRSHQLPGAFICVEHGRPLLLSSRLTSSSRERLAFHDVESSVSSSDGLCIDANLARNESVVLAELARQAVLLLRSGENDVGGLVLQSGLRVLELEGSRP